MKGESGIEWLNWPGRKSATWHPWIGCTPVSAGCMHCWARREEDTRFRHRCRVGVGGFACGPVYQGDEVLTAPLHWRDSRTVFVCPRSDLFHEGIPDDQIDRAFAVMALCPRHIFIVCTKRAARMAEWFDAGFDNREHLVGRVMRELTDGADPGLPEWPLRNVVLMVTAEDQQRADERIPHLMACPAVCRAVSIEPMLGPVDLSPWARWIDWVIVGGESCPRRANARPMLPEWARNIRDGCSEARVPFFFKQWGEWNEAGQLVGKRAAGCLLDGREHRELPLLAEKEKA